MKTLRKKRCDYCKAPAAVWWWYTGHMSYRGPYRAHGPVALNMAACTEHEGCVNWVGGIALRPEGRIERATG